MAFGICWQYNGQTLFMNQFEDVEAVEQTTHIILRIVTTC